RKVGRRLPRNKSRALSGEVSAILRTPGGARNVHHVAVAFAEMFVLDRVHQVAMPEHRVTRLHLQYGRKRIEQKTVIFRLDGKCAAGLCSAKFVLGYIVLDRA